MKRSNSIFFLATCLSLTIMTFWAGYWSVFSESWGQWEHFRVQPFDTGDRQVPAEATSADVNDIPEPTEQDDSSNSISHVKAILDPTDTTFPRLECLPPDSLRYEYLRIGDKRPKNFKYFFALDLRQSIKISPRLLGSIVEAIKFLGPATCVLSIVEGNSDDGTREVLNLLRSGMKDLGIEYYVQSSSIDPTAGDRIATLAQLRNMALSPLLSLASKSGEPEVPYSQSSPTANANTTVIFLNDVAICMTDILELVHQRIWQSADMTCAMDWTYVGRDPTFYDVWVARTLQGDLFFDIPPDGSWDSAWNLFWNDNASKERFEKTLPLQVYSCWNGAVVFGAAPILGEQPHREGSSDSPFHHNEGEKVKFRAPREGECYAGEPTLFCKDLWRTGHGRIAVIPAVNLEYSDEAATKIKALKGYTSQWTRQEDSSAMKIEWVEDAPKLVKCMPGLGDQSWRPWNETI